MGTLLAGWTAQVRARWAARRAQASEGDGVGGAWLDGDAAGAVICDAAMAPVVTGEVDVDALEELVRLCVELDRRRRGADHDDAGDDSTASIGTASIGTDGTGTDGTGTDGSGGRAAGPGPSPGWEALERAVIGKTMILLMHFPSLFDLRLFSVAGRIVRNSRRPRLRLPANWPWAMHIIARARLNALAPG
jgi:hypothetical protein